MKKGRNKFPASYILPGLVLAALVWAAPLVWAIVLSLTDASPGAPGKFIAFANYARALTDPRYLNGLWVSVVFAGGATTLSVGIGLALAIIFRRTPRRRAIAQTALLLPWVLSELAVALVWRGALDENFGLINAALSGLGMEGISFRTNPFWAMSSLWFATLWRGLAFSAMLQMAGIASLRESLIQSAKLSGAPRAMILRYIVIPHQQRVLAANALIVFMGGMVAFSLPFALTGGGPLFATETSALYAYNTAFGGQFSLGYAAAQGILVLVVYSVLATLYLRIRRKEA